MEPFWERVRTQAMSGEGIGREDALAVLSLGNDALWRLLDVTESVRRRFKGDGIRLMLHRQREVRALLGGLRLLRAVPSIRRRDRGIPPHVRGGDLPGSGGREGARGPGILDRRLRPRDAEPGGVRSRRGCGGPDPDGTGAGNVREPRDPSPVGRGVSLVAWAAVGSPQPGDVPLLLSEGVHHPRLRGGRGGGAGGEGSGSVGLLRRDLRAGRVPGRPRGAGLDAAGARGRLHPRQLPEPRPRHTAGGAQGSVPDGLPSHHRDAAPDEPDAGDHRLRGAGGEPARSSGADVRRRGHRDDGGELPNDGGAPGGRGSSDAPRPRALAPREG